ncbi:ABC transporter ATP-binding protein [Prauserella marina]|uniref:Peptide/nickel transport system ATP-binding protein n=1 Tax=Prauserella marina TaxID=530584 RepID=A0A222VU85_9PSEU|nr:ATP-binding cassette domain-containing protein [Prauserella marina]ASR37261.1 ABC transporter ATP-binding protein [Prauserella marina]PWV72593.1 peptide/nickel transport system ATP-binding protein [Prauserella marina]SDD76413.1 peptide/nickel transport system ATP-binding protein [Prauserella marina]
MSTAELSELTVEVDTGRWNETILDSVDLVVPAGRITVLLGESGCCKSMVAAALTGLLPSVARSTGDVRVNGTVVRDERQWRRLRSGTVGLVPQSGVTAFAAERTVGAQLHERRGPRPCRSVENACAAALYPTDVLDLYPDQHSSGQIQRAALAAALLPCPDLLVVDEPTASLDLGTAHEVWANLRTYADTGAALLTITHDATLAVEAGGADRMVFMRHGRIVATGAPAEMRALPDPYVRGFFPQIGQ